MNAALRAITKVAAGQGVKVLGVLDGYEGLMDARFRELTVSDGAGGIAADPELDFQGGMGGTLLGSARSARFREAEGRAAAAKNLAGIDGLIVLGGNGSLRGAHLLAQEHGVKVMGIPSTIDNDIGCTSTAIGVDTALNTIIDACDRISDTARAHRRAFVVEVMGRNSGYLAMASAIAAGADAALYAEQGRSEAELVAAVADVVRYAFGRRNKRRVLIIKAEGVQIPCTRLVRNVEETLSAEFPGIELRATVLGHLVRGGRPSFHERMVAGRFGFAAVNGLLEGATDQMVAWAPQSPGGHKTLDPFIQRFALSQVLEETEALLDGRSPLTQRRVKMMEAVEGVLSL